MFKRSTDRICIGKYVKRDQGDKSDMPAILMRRTNAGYRLLSRKSWRINAIIRANKECMDVIAESVVRSARLLGKSVFKLTGRPKRAKAEVCEARAQDECNYARCEGENTGAFVFIIFFEAANSIRVASSLNAPRRRMHLNEIVNLYSAFSRTD